MQSTSFKDLIADWMDKDLAAFRLAISLGLMQEGDFQGRAKHVFWSNHETGSVLYAFLENLIKTGILEENEDEQVRWNRDFKGSWQS